MQFEKNLLEMLLPYANTLFSDKELEEESVTLDLTPEKVIFSPPATIVFWKDGTKTVVKADSRDHFSEEFGYAMACMKKIYGTRAEFKAQFSDAVRCYPDAEPKDPPKAADVVTFEFRAAKPKDLDKLLDIFADGDSVAAKLGIV